MLPAEILVLILIVRSANAIPQAWPPVTANSTASPSPTIPTSLSSSYITVTPTTHSEITESSSNEGQSTLDPEETCTDGCVVDCATAMCEPFPIQIEVPTETGFENTSTMNTGKTAPTSTTPPATTTTRPTTTNTWPATNENAVTTIAPLIVNVQTNVAPSAANAPPATNGPSGGQPGPSTSGTPSSNTLLTDIISILGRPAPRPSNPSSNQAAPDDDNPQQLQQHTTVANSEASITPAPDAQPTAQLGQSMTLAGAIVTLTPGLSTTLGDGPAATYIAITSDVTGQTIITISSSGTAVTATVTNAPTTLTMTSGLETSVTGVGGPAGPGSSSTGAPASTPSVAGAVDKWEGKSWMVHVMVCIVGFGAAY